MTALDTPVLANQIAENIQAVAQPTEDCPAWLQALNDADLVSNEEAAADFIASKERKMMEETARWRTERDMMRAEIARRIHARGGTQLPHDDYIVEIKVTDKIDHRIDVLRSLEGKIPQSEFDAAICLVQKDPIWTANATKCKALAKRYGGEIAKIVDQGLPRVIVGSPKLVITPREELRVAA